MMELAFVAATAFTALATTTFVITFHLLASWWKSVIGINQMVLLFGLAAVFDTALVMLLLHTVPPDWLVWLGAGLYVLVGVAVWWRLGLMIRAQRRAARRARMRRVRLSHLAQVDTPPAG